MLMMVGMGFYGAVSAGASVVESGMWLSLGQVRVWRIGIVFAHTWVLMCGHNVWKTDTLAD